MPANVPALLYLPSLPLSVPPNLTINGFRLLDEADRAIEVTAKVSGAALLITPKMPLSPGGKYRAQIPQTCPAGQPTTVRTFEQTFTVTPAISVPNAVGQLKAVHYRLAPRTVWSAKSPGTCGATSVVTAAIARVEIDPSPELRALLATTNITVREGATWVTTLHQPQVAAGAPLAIEVLSTCMTDDAFADKGLAVGLHRLEVQAEIFGAATQPERLPVEIALDCTGASADGGTSSGDAGAPDQGGGAADAAAADGHAPAGDGGVDAGVPADAGPMARADASTADAATSRPSARDGGCSVAPTPPGNGCLTYLAGLAWLLRRRLRRR